MNNTTTLPNQVLTNAATQKVPGVKSLVFLAGLILTATICIAGWMYWQDTQPVRALVNTPGTQSDDKPNSTFLAQMDSLVLKLTMAMAIGGTGLTAVIGFGLTWWRRQFLNRIARSRQQWEEDSRKLQQVGAQLQLQMAERKRLQAELHQATVEVDRIVEERTSGLSRAHAQLEHELNERKQAEKALAQQAKELVRSKDVLELHVQARTQELEKLQRRYESILNSAGEGIYGLDLQGKTTFVNPAAAKLTGWKVEELVGKTEQESFHRLPPAGSSNTTIIARDEEHLTDQVFFRKDGSSFPVEYVRTPIMEKGKLVGSVVIFKDITERKRTEEALSRKAAELARSNAELEQFAYVASHDLQEPLRKIQAFGDRLKTKCDAVQLADGRDYLDRMQSAAARMQTLINDLLTFSRVISASQPFVPVDLTIVTREVLGDLEVRIEQTKAQVEVGELPTIEADPLQVRQLLQNLIGNALKFQPPDAKPVIKIQAQIIKNPLTAGTDKEGEGDTCQLTIQDNGIGFDEKYADKIFAVFQRLHGRNEYEGTGVGLAVCRRITDRHGGTVTATSKAGEGATFIVALPVRHPRKEEPQ